VSEAVLHVAIQELRRVLGDRARTPRLIETVHGRGYRFRAPVSALVAPSGSETGEAPPRLPSFTFGRPPHFVGRDAALAQLAQWWTAARRGRRQVEIIAGEAGIGKTALVDAFVAQVSAFEDLRVGHGQCVESYGAGEPYLPVLEALGRLGLGPDGPRVVSVLRQYAPSWLAQMPALLPPAEWEALQRIVGTTGQTRMLAGRLGEAHALAECALALARMHQARGHQAYALRLLGDIAVRREPPERALAEAYYRQALAMADDLGMRPLQAHCHLGLGNLYADIGRRAEAHAELSAAFDLYRAMEMTFWLPQAEVALAQLGPR
jgi:AAA ATPase domain/MalT-like TPR region